MNEPGVVEFDCEGCGAHVTSFGREEIPPHHMCAMCAWLCEHVPDHAEMMQFMDERKARGW